MKQKRRVHSPEFKTKVVLEILKGEKTSAQLAGRFGVHPAVLSDWKNQFLESASEIFKKKKRCSIKNEDKEKAELFEQIGRLKMELEWLKKKSLYWDKK